MSAARHSDLSDLFLSAARQFNRARRFTYASLKPDLTFDHVEQEFARMIGRPGEPMVGRPLTDLLWEFIGLENVLQEIFQGKRPQYRLEHVNREQKGGTIRYLTYLITPLNEIKLNDRLLLLVEDTTDYGRLHQDLVQDRNELRLIRQELAEANEELQQLNRLKSLFLAMAAHDLRGPLTSIHGFAEFLKEDVTGEKQLEFVEIIAAQSDRLRRLINDLLDLDQIEAGKLVLDRRKCNLNDVVHEVVTALRPTIEMRRQSINVNLPTRPLLIWADSERLTQVLYNLIDNAVKYTPEGGQVRITARRNQESIELEVQDTGRGMTDDQVARLFSLYYRAAEARHIDVPGTGLGLFIVKTLVEAHQGEISVESVPGRGTSFTVRLPANHKAEGRSDAR